MSSTRATSSPPIKGQAIAIAATTVWEGNSAATAGNLGGGGFNPGNANFAADLTTDANTGNTNSPVVSSASYNFAAADASPNPKWVYIAPGTNWTAGWYKIVSVASNKATLNAAVGAAIQTDTTKGYPTPRYLTNTVAGCATVGTPTGGKWGIDHSQATAGKVAAAIDLAVDAVTNTKVTSVTHAFDVSDIGNHMHITAGVGWTKGWYEVVNVAAGAATLDRSPAAVGTLLGTYTLGGAVSLNTSTSGLTDSNFFAAMAAGGNRVFLTGALTGAVAIAAGTSGGTQTPTVVEGYQTLRGDTPGGANRPSLAMAANGLTWGSNWDVYNLIVTGTAASVWSMGNQTRMVNCKVTNSSSTAGRDAVVGNSNGELIACELICYRGYAFRNGNGAKIFYCYIHDSDQGIQITGGSAWVFLGNLIAGCVTGAIVTTSNPPFDAYIVGNTLYGAENKLGIGVTWLSTTQYAVMTNNVIYGFVTGVSGPSSTYTAGYSDYNDYFDNTTDVTNWQKGANDKAVNPTFASVAQLTGSTATTAASVLTQTGADFTSVVDGRDFLYLVSGTGITAGIYGITSHTTTTLTLDIAPGTSATADKVWRITTGRNFAVGAAFRNNGFPGAFPGGLTTGYQTIGAAQPSGAVILIED